MEYALQDFLLFSPAVYQQMMLSTIDAYEPISFIVNIAALCLMIGIYQPQASRLLALLGSVCCMWLGWRFYIIDYSSINTFAMLPGSIVLTLIPVFFFLAHDHSSRSASLNKPVALLMLGYLCLLRPVIVFSLTEKWQLTPLGITPAPTLVLILTLLLIRPKVAYGIPVASVTAVLMLEGVTLYLVDDPMWHELPMLAVLLAAFIGSQRHKSSRQPLVSD